ncbi:ATP-dependent DNA ligase [Candidatus Pacearchaeota archaeon]|nr:ATP-dependent DNA ligase [Candidatus Pacearchaeota archaeon]
MRYEEFAQVYEKLSNVSGKIEKAEILASFLKELKARGKPEWIYLLRGGVVPEYDSREFGVSRQLALKALAKAYGIKQEKVIESFTKIGDIGLIAEELAGKRKQTGLTSTRLEAGKVFETLRKIFIITGKGSVDRKLALIAELLSHATEKEAKYLMRTLLADLRIGVAGGILVDALTKAFQDDEEGKRKIQEAYDLANDFALVFSALTRGNGSLEGIRMKPGVPVNPLLAVKADNIEDAFSICGKPAAFEYKYDGFRLMAHKFEGKIVLFTRRLEEVSKQFPDVVAAVKNYVAGESFILDCEAVGYDVKTGKPRPFEAVSQRIHRKHNIEKLVKDLPVVLHVFDIIYYNGKSLIDEPFKERRKLIEKIIREKEKVINVSVLKIIDNEKEAEKFYQRALDAGEEGVMIKSLEGRYQQGRKVGYMAKLKPEVKDLDLVIVGAEYGTGKRAGWLTSYYVACRSGDKFLEVGKVSSGLKEKKEEGTSYEEITHLLKKIVTSEEKHVVRVQPKIVVSVTYQNIQKSPEYSSKYALRFPRITHYRPDRNARDITSLHDIEQAAKR